MLVKYKKTSPNAVVPVYATSGSAGFDLVACLDEPVVIESGKFKLIGTGLSLSIPEGYEGQVRPRSGLAAKHGLTVLNSPGTIDSDYRGEIKVILINHGESEFKVENGMKIAQLVITPCVQAQLIETTEEENTERGTGGFGSTGV